jgi:hypothetical protein
MERDMKRLMTVLVALVATAGPSMSMFAMVPADRVDEVPVERLLENLERNAQNLPEAEKWRAIGRIHLLAWLKQAAALPVYRERPGTIAEGEIGDCAELDERTLGKGVFRNCGGCAFRRTGAGCWCLQARIVRWRCSDCRRWSRLR